MSRLGGTSGLQPSRHAPRPGAEAVAPAPARPSGPRRRTWTTWCSGSCASCPTPTRTATTSPTSAAGHRRARRCCSAAWRSALLPEDSDCSCSTRSSGAGRRAQLAQRAKAVLNDLQRTIKAGPRPRSTPAERAVEPRDAAGDSAHRACRVEVRGQDAAAERRGERRAPRGHRGSGGGGCRHRGALTRRVRRPRPARAGVARRGAGAPGSG